MKGTEWILKFQDKISAQLAKVSGVADTVSAKFTGLQDKIKKFESSAESAGSKIGGYLLGAGIITGVSALTSKIFQLTAAQQKYHAVLQNSLGSKAAADDSLRMLQDFATQTPYQLNEVTEAFTKMVNRGVLPSKDQLRSLGDLAAYSGKSLDQATEALLDAQTGEFERLKELGIKASVAGDKVSFAFKNQTTTIDNNSDAITRYLMGLGNLNGVNGSMASQMDTLGGKVSNVEDNFDKLLVTIGEQLLPVFDWTLGILMDLISNAPLVADVIYSVASAVGVLAAGWLVYKGYAIATAIAQWNLNAAFAANPIGIITMGLMLLIGTITYLWNRVEGFRGALFGMYEVAKFVFTSIKDIAVKYLTGVADLIMGILTLDVGKIKDGVKNIASAYVGIYDTAKGIGEKFELGYDKGAKQVRDRLKGQQDKLKNPLTQNAYDKLRMQADSSQKNRTDGNGSKNDVKKGINNVAGGGQSVKNIQFTIEALIRENKIIVTTIQEGINKTGDLLEERLVRVVQGGENVAI